MEYKLYQTEWNNIRLETIAHELGMPQESIASSDFYDTFYKKLDENGFVLDRRWLEEKTKMTKMLSKILRKIKCQKDNNIISLGCGTGVVEYGLIKEGYNIEFQECQSHSLGYLYKKGIKPSNVWITEDLEEIPKNSYDVVIMNYFLYVFDTGEGIRFLEKAKKLLNSNGRLVIVEGVGDINGMLEYWKNKLTKKRYKGVFWGYMRNLYELRRIMLKAGLKIEREFAINNDMQIMKKRPKTTLGFQNNNVHLWGWILKK